MYQEDACRIVEENIGRIFPRAREILDSMADAGLDKVMSFKDALPVAFSSAITEVTGLKGASVEVPFLGEEIGAVRIAFHGLPSRTAS